MLSHGVAIPIIMYFMNLFMCVMFPFPKRYTNPLGSTSQPGVSRAGGGPFWLRRSVGCLRIPEHVNRLFAVCDALLKRQNLHRRDKIVDRC